MTKIVAVVTGENFVKELEVLKEYKSYINAVEIRVDYIYPHLTTIPEILKKIKSISPSIEIILTFRWEKEGGKTNISENQRKKILFSLIQQNYKTVTFLDIEYRSPIFNEIQKFAISHKKKLIVSIHFTRNSKPHHIHKTVLSMIKSIQHKYINKSIIKVVIHSNNFMQYFNILSCLYRNLSLNSLKNLTIFTTGKTALTTRLIAMLLNMPLVYTATHTPVASNQPQISQLVEKIPLLGV
ncbi:MAG: type I 3-dehydroquinate dehydratase [Endomicrobia bacterium]|nr:type I 3-dehydroquinate dehydratase [Endomicrobiia bacterium]